jgi:uncharacterized protein (TIGR03118 family)
MNSKSKSSRGILAFVGLCLAVALFAHDARAVGYEMTNLVSDQPGVALVQDTNLVNPWGLAASATSPLWVANNGTGTATVYTSTASTSVSINPLVVSMPGTSPTTPITGQVFNGGAGFGGSRFIFAAEDGTINGWSSGGSAAQKAITAGANYKGLAIGNNGSDHLYATDFAQGTVNVFDSSFAPVVLAGSFTDPSLPAGYSPFGIRNLNSKLYVTYAVRNPATGDDVAGPGNGLVDVFDLNGNMLSRLITGGHLNSPWGLALAPATFNEFSNDLLVGNFGDGAIDAYDPVTGNFVGALVDKASSPIIIGGLWALDFGNGGNGGQAGVLYFTAGSGDEQHGLLGSISVPEPGTLTLIACTLLGLLRRRR